MTNSFEKLHLGKTPLFRIKFFISRSQTILYQKTTSFPSEGLTSYSSFSINRSFCQICQNCIREKNSAKKLPLTGVESSTLGLTVLLISCLSCLTTVLDHIS